MATHRTTVTLSKKLISALVFFMTFDCTHSPGQYGEPAPKLRVRYTENVHFICNTDGLKLETIDTIYSVFVFKTHISLAFVGRDKKPVATDKIKSLYPGRFKLDGPGKEGNDGLSTWLKVTLFDFDFSDYGNYSCEIRYEPKTNASRAASVWIKHTQLAPGRQTPKLPGFWARVEKGADATCVFDLDTAAPHSQNVQLSIVRCEHDEPLVTGIYNDSGAFVTSFSNTGSVFHLGSSFAVHVHLPPDGVENSSYKCSVKSSNKTPPFVSKCMTLACEECGHLGENSCTESLAAVGGVAGALLLVILVLLGYIWRINNQQNRRIVEQQEMQGMMPR
ncbi:hypothetical protein V1264_015613 [Littorina saxatilis]|uniref:Uncharacterized protein n=1 Tax=Littorina saxatilis TaxID=31220 RepID=A0AAN9GH65_9CAEN